MPKRRTIPKDQVAGLTKDQCLALMDKIRQKIEKPPPGPPMEFTGFFGEKCVTEDDATTSCWLWRGPYELTKVYDGRCKDKTIEEPIALRPRLKIFFLGKNRELRGVIWSLGSGFKRQLQPGSWIIPSCANYFCCNPQHMVELTASERRRQQRRNIKELVDGQTWGYIPPPVNGKYKYSPTHWVDESDDATFGGSSIELAVKCTPIPNQQKDNMKNKKKPTPLEKFNADRFAHYIKLLKRSKKPLRVADIARSLERSPSTVSRVIKRLKRDKFVKVDKDGGVTLGCA